MSAGVDKAVYADARPATLHGLRVIYSLLKGVFEPRGYLVTAGGSVLVYEQGRDIDIVMIRQREDASTIETIRSVLAELGFKRLMEEHGYGAHGWIGLFHDYAVDISVFGWTE